MAAGERAIKALSNVLRRVAESGRQAIREALEEGWPPGNNGGGGGGLFGRRRELVPVRVRVPVNNSPRLPERPPPSSFRWYSAPAHRWLSTDSFARKAFSHQARAISTRSSPARFTSVSARLSSVSHGTTFAHPIFRPRIGGTLHRSPLGYSLPGFPGRASVRHFSYNVHPMADVIANLSAGICASGIGASKLMGSVTRVGPSYVHNQKVNVFVTDDEAVRVVFSDLPKSFDLTAPFFTSSEGSDLKCTVATESRQIACVSFDITPTFDFGTFGTLSGDAVYRSFPKWSDNARDNLTVVVQDLQKLSLLGEFSYSVQYGDHGQQHIRVYFGDKTRDEVEHICRELDIRRGVVVNADLIEADAAMLATAGTAISDAAVPDIATSPTIGLSNTDFTNETLLLSPFSFRSNQVSGSVSVASSLPYSQLMPSSYGSEASEFNDLALDALAPWADNGGIAPPV
ncbi:uncharacterized protein V2V93DRAFT_364091 [Kockiozyma suomiensis]|uniref:uncharacterized protein n=1 Tax=Kockiozyma suomiensis TaxID=1337062 RepID=UPI003343D18B